ncbi:MAG: hypothetical protein WD715_05935 [Dongiaceae bacterium]
MDFIIAFSFLIGLIAGLRTMTAPAAVSWAAYLGWLPLDDGWRFSAIPSRLICSQHWRLSSWSSTSCLRRRAARFRYSSADGS